MPADPERRTDRDAVFDLRQYTLVPGARDTLIELFDRHFVDGQRDADIDVIGQFRDLDAPDRFVWLRGFRSMTARGAALPTFYGGPIWQAHREAANATMIDSDDALLLEPVLLGPAYPAAGTPTRGGVVGSVGGGVVGIVVAHLAHAVTDDQRDLARRAAQAITSAGAELVGLWVTHEAVNNFPALPLRDEHVVVWCARVDDTTAYAAHRRALAADDVWTAALAELGRAAPRPPQWLRLAPTRRSRLR